MKIIDWQAQGHLVRFLLGNDDLQRWYGDDWNDAPYEHNAGTVYREFIAGYKDICFPFDAYVIFPDHDVANSQYCKDDMQARKIPFLIVIEGDWEPPGWSTSFANALANTQAIRYYMGDHMEPDL